MYIHDRTNLSITEYGKVTFDDNIATRGGGGIYSFDHSIAVIEDYSNVTFLNNKAEQHGGAIHCDRFSDIYLKENISVMFTGNTAERGGAISIIQSSITLTSNVSATFEMNSAENGGAISIQQSILTFSEKSISQFISNTAKGNGGAIHLSSNYTTTFKNDTTVNFFYNSAQYGGAIYSELLQNDESKLIFNTEEIGLYNNTALTEADIYIDVPKSCDETCLDNSIVGINKTSLLNSRLKDHIITPPRTLEFYDIKCIDNHTNCYIYVIKNVMLGHEIITDACVQDYYEQPAEATKFVVSGNNHNHKINGSQVLISCTVFQGISVIGKRIFNATNFTISITSNHGSKSNFKTISAELITELSPCHPGFHYDNTTQTCVCYSDSDIVSCSGSASSIKRGYWFGEVKDKATVTICPNSYCNFTCCESANGFFKLSPVRANQCNSQRSGIACGSCKENYTLSFDSIECVSVDYCTTGQMLLVIILSVTYWIILVIAVFAMMYYRIGIGYLYAITYYYSIIDIILNQSLYTTPAIFTTVSIMSSIAKVTPQFLGQFCLIQNMSGIDQQFIHYIHPLAVTFILAMICLSARISYKISSLVSRGIIHVVCFLLLLSYSSVATTSLLIVRPLKFTIGNTVQVKTYLSPDIDYFHGRHLPYAIVAILCTISIAIGLPLLLLLEPFLNRKINFIRIKPLLDQFQGCYKDNCRYYAAYYMICRLVIIVIFISNFSNNNTMQYLLFAVSAVFALIQFVQKPYVNKALNLFDGLVLLSITFIAMIPLIDSSSLGVLLPITALLPLVSFAGFIMLIHRKNIKKLTKYFKPIPRIANNIVEVPMREYGVVVDDDMRKNATICEIPDRDSPDSPESIDERYIHYRESFIEAMNEIED
ncbi:putative leucine-rich repeat-containing protein DDB_G0281931 isoform X2 [Dysidea avara]|uniref:putative leucine-rich repeat-containing protein DDB_G0281931 isoform X2 n=1 Tax=Dysidea avara TaxID=196820 RepID=UPI0033198122